MQPRIGEVVVVISDDSRFNALQLNSNGICNKLTELEIALEKNKVKLAVIQNALI